MFAQVWARPRFAFEFGHWDLELGIWDFDLGDLELRSTA
jgi:hypothetical protein